VAVCGSAESLRMFYVSKFERFGELPGYTPGAAVLSGSLGCYRVVQPHACDVRSKITTLKYYYQAAATAPLGIGYGGRYWFAGLITEYRSWFQSTQQEVSRA